jgi:hypothetical protein
VVFFSLSGSASVAGVCFRPASPSSFDSLTEGESEKRETPVCGGLSRGPGHLTSDSSLVLR